MATETLKLRLYVTGLTPVSRRLAERLHRLFETELQHDYHLEVRDILEQPQAAMDDDILVTPTLLRLRPPPPRRLIGDLSRRERVLDGLCLQAGG